MYTLSTDRIAQVFSSLSGESADRYYDFCQVAGQNLCARLRNNISFSLRETELIYAAACMAFYRYSLLENSDGVSSYKAGDIRVSHNSRSGIAAAKELLIDAIKSISDCIKSEDFCFKSV